MFSRWGLVLVAAAFLGVGAARAQQLHPPAPFRESFTLEAPASFVAGHPVEVWCARNDGVWHAAHRAAGGDAYGFTQDGSAFFPAGSCRTIEGWKPGSRATSLFALDLLILVRESLHLGGVADEAVAQCEAKKKLAEVAIRFFGFRPRSAKIRELVRLAYVRASAIPGAC
jgi:hypothetical protein